MKITTILSSLVLIFFSSLTFADSTSQRLLHNSSWNTVLGGTTAKTLYKRNPVSGKVGAILAVSCAIRDDAELRVMNFVVGDRFTLPRKTAETIEEISFDPKFLNNQNTGVQLAFSNGKLHFLPMIKSNSGEVKLIQLSAISSILNDEVIHDFKDSEWVDVNVMHEGEIHKTFPSFSLENSNSAIENISNCYTIS